MLDPDACWAAVAARDTAADGRFVFAVQTTGVFCRPGCSCRLPLRRHVRFFATPAEAETAGFRPCKRCRPTDPSSASRHVAAIERACARIRDSEAVPSTAELAAAAGISRFHFHRVFRQVTGTTPGDYARTHRMGRLAARLAGGAPVAQSIYAAGFGSSSRAYAAAPAALGMTPAARRKGGDGTRIRFVTVQTALGWVLLATTDRGICAAEFGDSPETLEARLRARFPAAEVAGGDADLREWAERIVRFIVEPREQPELPLDIRGTAFQARVWRALQRIPPGRTASYAELAAAIGRPTAVRAVASAVAANGVALLVPCHRVVRSDGEAGGYRWGPERKRALLAREAEAQPSERDRAA
jgi:AraC family transcriptional regulator of adaptative response/methylated-DNA-[protein]-cysteine methyltransferase